MNIGKISLYGSTAMIVGALLTTLFVNAGIINSIFILLALSAVLGALYIFFYFVPQKWALTVIFIGFIAFIQYTIQSWLFSISLIGLMLIYVLFHVLRIPKRWTGTVLGVFVIVVVSGVVYDSIYIPQIENQMLDNVSADVQENRGVENASLETDGSEVHGFLVVNDDVLLSERTEIAETCAKKLSEEVETKKKRFQETNEDIGQLYNYYGLTLDVIPADEGKSIQATKGSSETDINWYINYYDDIEPIEDWQLDELAGKDFSMTAFYDARHLHFNAKNMDIHFNESGSATIKEDGETTEYDYSISEEHEIVFENAQERYKYTLDAVTDNEVLFLEGDQEGEGYIFKIE